MVRELEAYKARGATQAQLASRIGKRADQVSRWLSNPGNLTLDTISDLLLGLSGGELKMGVEYPTKVQAEIPSTLAWLVTHQTTKAARVIDGYYPFGSPTGYAVIDMDRSGTIVAFDINKSVVAYTEFSHGARH